MLFRSAIIKLALSALAKALIRAGALAVHHRLDRGVIRQLLAIDLLDLFPQLARGIFVALRAQRIWRVEAYRLAAVAALADSDLDRNLADYFGMTGRIMPDSRPRKPGSPAPHSSLAATRGAVFLPLAVAGKKMWL